MAAHRVVPCTLSAEPVMINLCFKEDSAPDYNLCSENQELVFSKDDKHIESMSTNIA